MCPCQHVILHSICILEQFNCADVCPSIPHFMLCNMHTCCSSFCLGFLISSLMMSLMPNSSSSSSNVRACMYIHQISVTALQNIIICYIIVYVHVCLCVHEYYCDIKSHDYRDMQNYIS